MVQQRETDKYSLSHTLRQPGAPPLADRSPRGFQVNGLWYFELRGGGQKGPFDSEAEMQKELQHFIQFYNQMKRQN